MGEDRGGPVESRGGPAPSQLNRVLRHGSAPSFKHVECVRNSSATRVSMRFWNKGASPAQLSPAPPFTSAF
ncbi:MAG: hypothetical protein DME21_14925 [Verrucomicrobia bacterium]|nr:MAG: hypothetical protein DME21_14925 [Verrucomicrobiota bacterium]